MDNDEFLMRQYEKMIDLWELHHNRWTDHWRTYLTVLALVTLSIAAIIRLGDNQEIDNAKFIILGVSVLGSIISMAGWISLNKIKNDIYLHYSQLRMMEGTILNEIKDKRFLHIFINCKDFSNKGSFQNLRFTPRWPGFLIRINQYHLATVTFCSFLFFFFIITILIIKL